MDLRTASCVVLTFAVIQGAVLARAADDPSHDGFRLSQWIAEFQTSDSARRSRAVKAFVVFGPKAAPAIPALIADIQTKSSEAVLPLVKIGAPAVPALLPLLDAQHDAATRQKAMGALGGMNAQAAPPIAAGLEGAPAERQKLLFDILGRMESRAEPAAPAIERWLGNADPETRLLAAIALAQITPRSNPKVIPVLRAAIRADKPGSPHGGMASYALWKALDAAAVQFTWQECDGQGLAELCALLTSAQPSTRMTALTGASVIVAHGRNLLKPAADAAGQQALYARIAQDLYPGVVDNLGHADGQVRSAALHSLGAFGELAAATVPQLVESLARDPAWTEETLRTLGAIGPSAVAAAPHVKALTSHANPQVKQAAAEALARIVPAASSPANNSPAAGKTGKLLARDRHEGFTGFKVKDNVYQLAGEEELAVRPTRLRYQAWGDRNPNSAGTISVSVDQKAWHEVGTWTKFSCEKAARADNWHTLDLTEAPDSLRGKKLYVRFQYTGGTERLNVSEVLWERP